MSISIIANVFLDVHGSAVMAAQRVEAAVRKAVRAPSSFHGGTWLYPSDSRGLHTVGGLFKFERTLRAPPDVEARGIVRELQRVLTPLALPGSYMDVRLLVTDHLPWVGGETKVPSSRRSRR